MNNNDLIKIGTLTITGNWPMEIDGLDLGYSKRLTRRYQITDKGFVRAGKLFKTHDYAILLQVLGVKEAKWSEKHFLPLSLSL